MSDFFAQLNPVDPTSELKTALVSLFDAMLGVETLTDAQREQLARLRARTEIDLTDF